jgi:hypothetical protein
MLATITSGQIGQILEGGMMLCFGVSWPFAIYRTWKSKRVEGKSLVFLVVVLVGYIVGVGAKFARAAGGEKLETVTFFYGINIILVAIDLCLYLRYRSRNAAANEIVSPPVE